MNMSLSGEAQEFFQRAVSFHQSGELDEALHWYLKTLQFQPENVDVLTRLGLAYQAHGKKEEAIESFRKVVTLRPDIAVAHYNLANVLQEHGSVSEAVEGFRKAASINPGFFEAHGNLGVALRKQGKLDEAIASCRKAVSINPSIAEAHSNLGTAQKQQGDFDGAVASFQQAVSIKPEFAEAHSNLGSVLREQGKLNEAAVSSERAISLNPSIAEAHSNLGNVLIEQGKIDEAVACCQRAISIDPSIAIIHYNLGNALQEKGDLVEAIHSFQKAVAIEPDFEEAQHILNAILGKTTKRPPRKYVESLFDAYAGEFEARLVDKLEYKMPSLLKKTLINSGVAKSRFKAMLDLGCGTGLAGVAFKDVAESLVGIDLSGNMIREAETKDVYDELYVDDIIDRLGKLEKKFDLTVAADVLVYIGELRELFNSVRQHSTEGALFVFSTEHADSGEFSLQNTGRYTHSKEYVLSVATEAGFHLEHFSKSNLRKEKGTWILGGIYLFSLDAH